MVRITVELLRQEMEDLVTSPFFHILLALVFLDILTGYAKAFKTKTLDSKVSTNGWIRHVIVIIITFMVGIYARALGYVAVSYIVCTGFIGSYGLSVLENLDVLGVKYNPKFKEFFKQMRETGEVNITKDGKIKMDVTDQDEITIDRK